MSRAIKKFSNHWFLILLSTSPLYIDEPALLSPNDVAVGNRLECTNMAHVLSCISSPNVSLKHTFNVKDFLDGGSAQLSMQGEINKISGDVYRSIRGIALKGLTDLDGAVHSPHAIFGAVADGITEYITGNTTVMISYTGTTSSGPDPVVVDTFKVTGKCAKPSPSDSFDSWMKEVESKIIAGFTLEKQGKAGVQFPVSLLSETNSRLHKVKPRVSFFVYAQSVAVIVSSSYPPFPLRRRSSRQS